MVNDAALIRADDVHKPPITNVVASLCGARLVSPSELNTGQRLDTALVKRITGAETLKARFFHQEFFRRWRVP